jgi:Zn-dependent peptidase ImmA (M78 family)
VLGLSEAAWVVRKQIELAAEVGKSVKVSDLGFVMSNDYGSAYNPAWRIGYELAARSRNLLGIGQGDPIKSLKELIEFKLGIPVVQMDLPPSFAGATVANGDTRGIVVNLKGLNANVWVRRMTLAHELGHLLWDPDHRLQKLVVDQYEDLDAYADVDRSPRSDRDYVEMRANGFAVEFLAPREATKKVFESAGGDRSGIEAVMSIFGISKTAATYHLENAYNRTIDLSSFRLPSWREDTAIHLDPPVDWIAREELAVDFFKPQSVPISRRGRFAAHVARMVERGLCSKDSAAALLQCHPDEIGVALESIKSFIDQEPVI